MPRYEADPTLVSATLTILPKDDYEFKCGKPKAFEKQAKAGHQTYGFYLPLVVVNGPQNGKKTLARLYLHSEGAAMMTKRLQIAAYGLPVNEKNEKEFDAWAAGKDWSFDTSDGTMGAAWNELLDGKHICCDLDVAMVKNDKDEEVESQVWGSWRPVATA